MMRKTFYVYKIGDKGSIRWLGLGFFVFVVFKILGRMVNEYKNRFIVSGMPT